jgi:hypothetical protein
MCLLSSGILEQLLNTTAAVTAVNKIREIVLCLKCIRRDSKDLKYDEYVKLQKNPPSAYNKANAPIVLYLCRTGFNYSY